MSVEPKERWYDTIIGPVVTEKSTQGSEHNQVTFRGAHRRDQVPD